MREAVGAVAVVIGAATLAGVAHHAGGQGTHASEVVRAAAGRLTYREVSDAWAQSKQGDLGRLQGIVRGVPLRYLTAHADGVAVVLTFASREGTCVDLVARPTANAVKTHQHC